MSVGEKTIHPRCGSQTNKKRKETISDMTILVVNISGNVLSIG